MGKQTNTAGVINKMTRQDNEVNHMTELDNFDIKTAHDKRTLKWIIKNLKREGRLEGREFYLNPSTLLWNMVKGTGRQLPQYIDDKYIRFLLRKKLVYDYQKHLTVSDTKKVYIWKDGAELYIEKQKIIHVLQK